MKKFFSALFILTGMLFAAAPNACSQLSVSLTLLNPVCNHDGIVVATLQNSSGINTYYWSGTSVNQTITTSLTTDTLFNFSGGFISVFIMPATGGNGAYQFLSVPFPFNLSYVVMPDTCPLQTGSILVTDSGGVQPMTYSWTMNGSAFPGTTNQQTGLAGGLYDCLVSDASGCQVYLHDLDSMSLGIMVPSVNNISITMNTTPANCLNGTATASPAGGTAPYTYLWSNGQTTQTATGLTANSQQVVTVTDANGCLKEGYTYVATSSSFNQIINATPAHCTFSDGAAASVVMGGAPPYTYLWSTGATTSTITGVPAGYYIITATDGLGCIKINYANITSLTPVNVTYTQTASQCTTATGSVTANVSGGTPPYTYLWYTSPQQTTVSAVNVPPGMFNVLVTDAQGCVRSGTVSVAQNTTLAQSITATGNTGCTMPNGTATLIPAGGVPPYQYQWSNGQTLSSCTQVAGFIYGTVTDADGCHVTNCVTVPSIQTVNGTFSVQPASCKYVADGSISATASGGTPPYTYDWSNGSTSSSINGLLPGYYSVVISDAAGCYFSHYINLQYNSITPCTGTIAGIVFNDLNGNCTADAGEPVIENIPLLCSSTGEIHYTDFNGSYSFMVPVGNSDIMQLHQPYRIQQCPAANPFTVTIPSVGAVVIQDISDSIIPVNDLATHMYNLYSQPVIGSSFIMRITEENDGTVALSPSLDYDYQPQAPYSYASTAPLALNVPQHTAQWSGGLLNPLETQYIDVTHSVPANVPLNTMLYYTDTLWPIANDTTWWNNTSWKMLYTLGSYDPNYKEVSPAGTGAQGFISQDDSVLEYVIHFQNIGNYYAMNIVLIDTLDADLDWSSLRVGYSTAPHKTEISADGVLKMTFENIYLPGIVQDTIGSNGFASYTIQLKPGLADGTEITNSADIYFDLNSAVKTNTTLNTIMFSAVNEPERMSLQVYPNPSDGNFMIRFNNAFNGDVTLSMYDVTGQKVFSGKKEVMQSLVRINTLQVDNGIYLLEARQGNRTAAVRMVVAR